MKKILKTTLILSSFILLWGCEDEFLEKQPSEFITQDQVADAAAVNPDVVAGTMTGIYSQMFETETGGTTGHDDFGHKGYDLFADMLASDVALSVSTYGWYRASITEYQATQDFTFTDNYQVWRYYYRIVRSANTVIDALGGNDAEPELEENKWILGQAKAIRAHSYFYLTQYFQKTYNPSEEILPIYTSTADENGPKVAASVIYDLIEDDLTSAIDLLQTFNRPTKAEINLDVAKGILAYVYAAMGRDGEAANLTAEIIEASNFPIMTQAEVLGGFNNLDTPGWMWGVDLNVDTGVGLVSWWGQMDYYSYSYAAVGDPKVIDSDLYDQIPDNDVRKNQFNFNPGDITHLQPHFKFYDENRVVFGASQLVNADYVYMRISEMYLLHAETAAKSGNEASAKTALKALLDLRIPDSSYVDGLSGQALLDEIYFQTRVELWAEGKTYLALKRNGRSVNRGPNHLSFVGETISHDDERMTFEIPELEILNNPAVSNQNQ